MSLNFDIFGSTDKWAKSDQFFNVFSGQDARIELNPFALYQASQHRMLGPKYSNISKIYLPFLGG